MAHFTGAVAEAQGRDVLGKVLEGPRGKAERWAGLTHLPGEHTGSSWVFLL